MEIWRSMNGMVCVKVIGADIARTLSSLQDRSITVYHVSRTDDLTVTFRIKRQDYKKVKQITQHRGDRLVLSGKNGLYWTVKNLIRRPVLVGGLLLLLILCCFLPTRIYFFRVEGNSGVPTRLILEQAAQCGISFGASRRDVRSEKMKNALLEALPQLQWAGINTKGCVATISVREREDVKAQPERKGVSNLVASRDGVILSCTATKGSLICKVGQAVKAGEVLVSGYTDCGLTIRASQAEGEVFAQTEHHLTVCALAKYEERVAQTAQVKKYSLIIGKKQIKFYKDSGILDTGCVKMYYEHYITLPGGFQLPVALVTEIWTYYACSEQTQDHDLAARQMSGFASAYLQENMIAGQILTREESAQLTGAYYCLEGQYACQEMIGRVQKEEIIPPNGKYD